MAQPLSLSGSSVLITGGARGMGRLMALGSASRGARHVVLWDLQGQQLAEVAREVESLGAQVSIDTVDVTDHRAVEKAAKRALKSAGSVDIVINNAGVISGKDFLDLSPEEIMTTFQVNTLSLYWTSRAFLPAMLEANRGRIVTIASAAASAGVARQTDYSASKHAAMGFTESLRAELRQRGSAVSTLTVKPYYVNAGMFDGVKSGSPLLPIQEPEPTVAKILDAIESTRREILIPRMVYAVRIFRLLPARWFDQIADLFGINRSMRDFVGRPPTA